MATLWLLRHAKSAWDEPGLADHERPLSPRGRRACEMLRAHCADHVEPALVVCSTALRTRQTLARVWPDSKAASVVFDGDVYEAPPERLASSIERHGAKVSSLLLVGHNPGIQELALWLAGEESAAERSLQRLRAKVPTGALLRFEVPVLGSLSRGVGTLESFVTPKGLAKGRDSV